MIVITLKYEVDPVPGQDVGALPGVSQEGVKLLLTGNLYNNVDVMFHRCQLNVDEGSSFIIQQFLLRGTRPKLSGTWHAWEMVIRCL